MSATKKRLTDASIWDKDWFIDLPIEYKLSWFFIKDECDHAGIWSPQKWKLEHHTGKSLTIQEIIKRINFTKERLFLLPNKKVLVCEFFLFQYGKVLNFNNRVHCSIGNIYVREEIPLSKTGINHIISPTKEILEILDSQDLSKIISVKN